ncbi:ferric reductase [Paenibacillus aurantius]|uniref:Ferric reductase n=1 Tax=Paenibacillus aurantius TaxID=2918900 RepID=A0AA96RG89_9BACL|nr:ferric reductase [Paenibacillus aurantius]WNQ09794.1 ferric reductase [Paenibacillus aurantius]
MAVFLDLFPAWGLMRLLGLVSYVLLFAGVSLGILYSFPTITGKSKLTVHKAHLFATNGGTLLGLLHGVITVIDTYTPFTWSDVLIPFSASHSPVLTGIGTLTAYGLLVLIFTSDIRHKLGRKLWLAIHFLAYPIFAGALIHGFFEGTDTKLAGIRLLYAASVFVILTLTILRGMLRRPETRHQPAGRTL